MLQYLQYLLPTCFETMWPSAGFETTNCLHLEILAVSFSRGFFLFLHDLLVRRFLLGYRRIHILKQWDIALFYELLTGSNMSDLGKFATAWEKFRYSQSKLRDICEVYGRTSSKTMDSGVETELSDKRRPKFKILSHSFFSKNNTHLLGLLLRSALHCIKIEEKAPKTCKDWVPESVYSLFF